MSKTIKLDIPDAVTGARQSVIRSVLKDLVSHSITMEAAVKSIDHLTIAAANMQRHAGTEDREPRTAAGSLD
jgi:hypothetical protein